MRRDVYYSRHVMTTHADASVRLAVQTHTHGYERKNIKPTCTRAPANSHARERKEKETRSTTSRRRRQCSVTIGQTMSGGSRVRACTHTQTHTHPHTTCLVATAGTASRLLAAQRCACAFVARAVVSSAVLLLFSSATRTHARMHARAVYVVRVRVRNYIGKRVRNNVAHAYREKPARQRLPFAIICPFFIVKAIVCGMLRQHLFAIIYGGLYYIHMYLHDRVIALHCV